MTTIQDTITYANGQLVNGEVVVSWDPFLVGSVPVAGGSKRYEIIDGVLQLELIANAAAQPVGTYYTAKYELESGKVYEETWIVPQLDTVNLGQIRIGFPPTPSSMINIVQLSSGGAAPGMFLMWDGLHWVTGYPSAANISPNFIRLLAAGAPGADISWIDGNPVVLGDTATLNIPDAGPASRGVVTAEDQTFGGVKTFEGIVADEGVFDNITVGGVAGIPGMVHESRRIDSGAGLTGGGDLSADRTLSVVPESTTQRLRMASAGALVSTRPEINFIPGANVTLSLADDAVGNRANLTITGLASGHVIQDEGVGQPHRAALNFAGGGVTASDDSANNCTLVTIPAGLPGPEGPQGPQGIQGPPGAANSTYNREWVWSNVLTLPPNLGQVRTDTGNWTAATKLFVDNRSNDGTDRSAALRTIKTGDEVRTAHKTDASRWAQWEVTGAPIARSGYFEIPVSFLSSGGTIPNTGTQVLMTLFGEGATASQWYTGPAAPPSPTLGRIGDMYLEGDGDVWHNEEPTGWTLTTTNIRGPEGAASTVPGPAGIPLKVNAAVIGDASSGGSGGDPQTPWASDIDAAGFDLANVATVIATGQIESQSGGFKFPDDSIQATAYADPLSAKGDLVTRSASALVRLPVGANGHVLTADSAAAQGIKWAAAGGASQTPWTSDINAAGFNLSGAGLIESVSGGVKFPDASTQVKAVTKAPVILWLPAAGGEQGGSAEMGTGWTAPTTGGVVQAVASGSYGFTYFNFTEASDQTVYFHYLLPANWDGGTIVVRIPWRSASGATVGHVFGLTVATARLRMGEAIPAGPTFNTDQTPSNLTLAATTSLLMMAQIAALTMTGIAASDILVVRLKRTISDTLTVAAHVLGIELSLYVNL